MGIEYIIIEGWAVAAITFTITTTSIFSWLRELVSRIHPKIEELIHCPWCLAFWVLLTYERNMLVLMSAWTVAGLCHYVLLRAYDPVRKAMFERQMEKINNNGKNIQKSITGQGLESSTGHD